MKYYLLQIKEGPGPFYDCTYKWLSNGYAAVFPKDNLSTLKKMPITTDVLRFIDVFQNIANDDSIIISIGTGKDGIDTLFIYKKDGPLEEINNIEVEDKYYKKVNYKDIAIGFKIKLLKSIHVVDCPLVLATIKSNTRLTMGTFKSIEKPTNKSKKSDESETHLNSYFGNIKALEYIMSNKTKKSKVYKFPEYLECLSPIEFETLVAKLKEEMGYFVPAYKGGMLKDYDLICKKDGIQENIQIKLNLSKDTYNKYKNKNLKIYCVSQSNDIINPEIEIFNHEKILEMLNNCPNTKEWLKKSLDWVDFNF